MERARKNAERLAMTREIKIPALTWRGSRRTCCGRNCMPVGAWTVQKSSIGSRRRSSKEPGVPGKHQASLREEDRREIRRGCDP